MTAPSPSSPTKSSVDSIAIASGISGLLRFVSLSSLLLHATTTDAFSNTAIQRHHASNPTVLKSLPKQRRWYVSGSSLATTTLDEPAVTRQESAITTESIFDFSASTTIDTEIDKMDRLDDAIMGGISTSSIQSTVTTSINDVPESYASWGGICRTDGGGYVPMVLP